MGINKYIFEIYASITSTRCKKVGLGYVHVEEDDDGNYPFCEYVNGSGGDGKTEKVLEEALNRFCRQLARAIGAPDDTFYDIFEYSIPLEPAKPDENPVIDYRYVPDADDE